MAEMTTYAPGTPCWIDLATPDIDASVGFYGTLFGWDVPESENPEQTGGYRLATFHDKSAVGMMPMMQEGQPPAWTTYVSVEDADATAAAVREAGGTVMAEPMDVMDLGRMAIFSDPAGAVFGIWQPGSFAGAELVNETGTLSWNELNTRDPEAAKSFYTAVFGWGTREMDMGDGGPYTLWRLAGSDEDAESIGGMLDMRGRVPDHVPPHWLAYINIEDCDGTIEKAKGLGAVIPFGPVDLPMGRFAIMADPQGAHLAVFQRSDQ